MAIGRREFVSGASFAVLGSAGCLGVNQGGSTDITVTNDASKELMVTIRVTKRSDDTELLDETLDLDAGATKEYDEVVSGAEVRVYVGVQEGPEKVYNWSDGESDAQGLFVDVTTDSITFKAGVR